MHITDYRDVPAKVEHDLPGVTARWPIREEDGAPHFAMRVFDVEHGCNTPLHSHWWEHEVFVLDGQGYIVVGDERAEIRPGTVVFVPGDALHQLINTGEDVLRFICLIPHMWLKGVAEEHGHAPIGELGVC